MANSAFNSSPVDLTTSVTGTLPVANGGTGVTTSTGSGSNVLGTSPTITTPNIVGTSTNNNASAGSVGEIVSSAIAVGSAVSLTTNVTANVTSISLTAGDWDISGTVLYSAGASTITSLSVAGFNTTSATLPAAGTKGYTIFSGLGITGNLIPTLSLWKARLSLSGTTTVYLTAFSSFTTSTNAAYGTIEARRVR